jgi:phosphoglycolate phosphatase
MNAVLWDLDGTLVDSAADIADAIDAVLASRGLPPVGEARVRGFIGDGARQLVDRCWGAVGAQARAEDVSDFLERYAQALVVRTRVYDGLEGLLARIDAPQAICTNKPEAHAREIVERLGLARYFPVLLGGDSLPTRKPDPLMLREAVTRLGAASAVLVGDGPADVEAGARAGVPVIGVRWGIAVPEGAPVRVDDVGGLEAALRVQGIRVAASSG